MASIAAINALNAVVLAGAGIDPPEWFVKLFLFGVASVAPLTLYRMARMVVKD